MPKESKSKDKKVKIYILSDPETNDVRYVGMTSKTLKQRLAQHIKESKDGSQTYKCNWIRSLLKKYTSPIIEEVEECTAEQFPEREQYWISQFKAWGFKLTNLTDGGEGTFGYKFSKEKIYEIKRNRVANRETIFIVTFSHHYGGDYNMAVFNGLKKAINFVEDHFSEYRDEYESEYEDNPKENLNQVFGKRWSIDERTSYLIFNATPVLDFVVQEFILNK